MVVNKKGRAQSGIDWGRFGPQVRGLERCARGDRDNYGIGELLNTTTIAERWTKFV